MKCYIFIEVNISVSKTIGGTVNEQSTLQSIKLEQSIEDDCSQSSDLQSNTNSPSMMSAPSSVEPLNVEPGACFIVHDGIGGANGRFWIQVVIVF